MTVTFLYALYSLVRDKVLAQVIAKLVLIPMQKFLSPTGPCCMLYPRAVFSIPVVNNKKHMQLQCAVKHIMKTIPCGFCQQQQKTQSNIALRDQRNQGIKGIYEVIEPSPIFLSQNLFSAQTQTQKKFSSQQRSSFCKKRNGFLRKEYIGYCT